MQFAFGQMEAYEYDIWLLTMYIMGFIFYYAWFDSLKMGKMWKIAWWVNEKKKKYCSILFICWWNYLKKRSNWKRKIAWWKWGWEKREYQYVMYMYMYPFSSCSSQLYKSLFVIVSRDSIHPAMRMRWRWFISLFFVLIYWFLPPLPIPSQAIRLLAHSKRIYDLHFSLIRLLLFASLAKLSLAI
jgi:hypothetical protein